MVCAEAAFVHEAKDLQTFKNELATGCLLQHRCVSPKRPDISALRMLSSSLFATYGGSWTDFTAWLFVGQPWGNAFVTDPATVQSAAGKGCDQKYVACQKNMALP